MTNTKTCHRVFTFKEKRKKKRRLKRGLGVHTMGEARRCQRHTRSINADQNMKYRLMESRKYGRTLGARARSTDHHERLNVHPQGEGAAYSLTS